MFLDKILKTIQRMNEYFCTTRKNLKFQFWMLVFVFIKFYTKWTFICIIFTNKEELCYNFFRVLKWNPIQFDVFFFQRLGMCLCDVMWVMNSYNSIDIKSSHTKISFQVLWHIFIIINNNSILCDCDWWMMVFFP